MSHQEARLLDSSFNDRWRLQHLNRLLLIEFDQPMDQVTRPIKRVFKIPKRSLLSVGFALIILHHRSHPVNHSLDRSIPNGLDWTGFIQLIASDGQRLLRYLSWSGMVWEQIHSLECSSYTTVQL